MAINTKYNIKTQDGIYQTMHFETNANQVITTDEKQFVSQAEKEIWNNMSSSENIQEQITSSINKLKEEVEPKIIKKSAFNKHFGNGPDSVAEGDHVHNDVALKIKNIENKLNLNNSIVNSQEFFSDITPESSIWSATSGKYVSNIIKEDGRFQFDVTNVDQGLETETLTSLLSTLTTGTEVAISCNVESENTIVYIKLKYSTGWEFVRMRINDDLFKTVKIKEGLIDFKLAIESSLSSKNTCIVTNLKLMIKNPVQITSNQDIPNRNYSIWSWTTDSVLDAHDTSVFLKNYKINKVYQHFDLDSLTYNDIRNYVKVLQEKDIMVNWLTGDPSWALTNKHSKILNAIRKINDYNKYITNGYQKINTIQFDIEPYTLDEWNTDEQGVIEQYQEAISIAYEECLRLGLSMAICIPSWFDSKTYNNKFGEGNLYDFVSKNSSCTVLMAYNVNNYLSISADEIKMNKENRKRIAIGLETKPVGKHSLTTDETFGDKPISNLYSAFETIYQYLSTISFDDRYEFAIHDLVAFKNYTASFDLDIVSFEGDGPLSSKENIVLKSNSGLSGTYKTEVKSGNNILEITSTDAYINNKGLTYNGNVVYHAGNKPTANEINAASILHTHTGTQVALTGYAKPTTTSAIATTDNVNVAIGKLEKALDGKQATGSYAAANHNHDSAYLGKTATAAAATKLVTARTINGTNFDGSANITTSKWGAARSITIGNTTKTVDGSGNVSWTLAEIGATGGSGNYLPLSGGTLTGDLTIKKSDGSASKLNIHRILSSKDMRGSIDIYAHNGGSVSLSTYNMSDNKQTSSYVFGGDAFWSPRDAAGIIPDIGTSSYRFKKAWLTDIDITGTANLKGVIYGQNNIALARGSLWLQGAGGNLNCDYLRFGTNIMASSDSKMIYLVDTGGTRANVDCGDLRAVGLKITNTSYPSLRFSDNVRIEYEASTDTLYAAGTKSTSSGLREFRATQCNSTVNAIIAGKRLFIQGGTPSGVATGDVWIQV